MQAEYNQPENLAGALRLVAQGHRPLGGGTAVYTAKSHTQESLVDISGLREIRQIEQSGDWVKIGASVTFSELAAASDIPSMTGELLRRSVQHVGSLPLRNAITVGGNVAHAVYWADLPVLLLALDAELQVSKHGAQAIRIPVASAFTLRGKKVWDGGLITHAWVPVRSGGFGYERMARTSNDYSFATACVTLQRQENVVCAPRIVVGAVQAYPMRLTSLEGELEGKPLDDGLLRGVVERGCEAIPIMPSPRASIDYRRELLAVLVRRAIVAAWAGTGRES